MLSRDTQNTIDRIRPRSLRHAVAVSTVRWVVSLVFMAIVFPVMLARLGAADFGYWASLTAPTGMTGLFGLGFAPAIVALMGREVGHARTAESEHERERALRSAGVIAAVGMGVSLVAALVAVVVGWFLAPHIVAWVHVPVSEAASGVHLFRASSIALGCMVVGAGIGAQIEAVGRVDLAVLATGIVSVSNSILLLIAMLVSPSLDALALVALLTGVSGVLLPLAMALLSGATAMVPWYRIRSRQGLVLLRTAPGYGGAGAVTSLIDPLIKWSLGASLGPLPVSAYELATRVVSALSGVFMASLYPLMAHSATGLGRGDGAWVTRTVTISVQRVTAAGFPSLAALAVASTPLLAVWLGSEAPSGTSASIQVLCVATALSLAAFPACQAVGGRGAGNLILLIQGVTLAGVAVVSVGMVPEVLTAPFTGAVAFAFGVLLATPVAAAAYGRVYGRSHMWAAAKAALPSIIAAGLVLPWPILARVIGAGAILQLLVTVIAWGSILAVTVKRGSLGDGFSLKTWRRGLHGNG
jgi:O-antigen/teichoic acid export membrane protein